MLKPPTEYDSNAFPPSLGYSSAFLAAFVIGVLGFELLAATLAA